MNCGVRILTLVSIVALVGCGRHLPVVDHNFNVISPDEWKGGELGPVSSGADWWTYFNNEELDHIVTEALNGNPDIRAAVARVETARAEGIIAGAPLLPEANISLNRGQQRQNFIGFPIPGSERNILSTSSTNYGLRLNASWEPDLWGRIRSGEVAAVTNTRARIADRAAIRLSLTGQVARSWLASIEAQSQLRLAEVSLESFRVSAERVRVRFESGIRPSLDLRLALTEVALAEATIDQRLEERERRVRELETLMGRYPAGDYPIGETIPDLPNTVPGGLPSELVHRRPDLVAAELQLVAADIRIAQAQADLRPRFSLTSGAGTLSGSLIDIIDNDLFIWNFVGNLVKPLFDNGRLKAAVVRNKSQAEEAIANYESLLLQAYREVESALVVEALLSRRFRAVEDAVLQSNASQRLAENRYKLGLTDIITVLSAQRSAYNSESQLLGVRRLRLENRINLHLALGGGFDISEIPSETEYRRKRTLSEGGS